MEEEEGGSFSAKVIRRRETENLEGFQGAGRVMADVWPDMCMCVFID